MKLKIITTVSTIENSGLKALEHSLKLFGHDYKIIQDPGIAWNNWGGWPWVINWCKSEESKEYTHIVYTDGFDTLALTGPEEVKTKLSKLLEPNPEAFIYSVEKHWFPHPEGWEKYANMYVEKTKHLRANLRWRFVNGGQYAGSIQSVINWYEKAPKDQNNQAYGNIYYSQSTDDSLILDFNCELFQAISHSGKAHGGEDEFTTVEMTVKREESIGTNKRLQNNLTNSYPCFVHANGIKNHDESKWMYDILNLSI